MREHRPHHMRGANGFVCVCVGECYDVLVTPANGNLQLSSTIRAGAQQNEEQQIHLSGSFSLLAEEIESPDVVSVLFNMFYLCRWRWQ